MTELKRLPEDLAEGSIVINVPNLPVPQTLEDLQTNFASFEASIVGVSFE